MCHGGVDELFGSDEDCRDSPDFKIVDVVHTARGTTASIGKSFDDDLALGGDLVSQVDRSRLGECRLAVAVNLGSDVREAVFDAV